MGHARTVDHMSNDTGFVYILTNEAMPGLIKIGRTSTSVEQRLVELDTTATPLPFECFYAARVNEPARVETALHVGFGDSRVRARREFFRIDPTRVAAVLQLLALDDATPRQNVIEDPEASEALERATRRRPRYPFSVGGIPVGAVLTFSRKPSETCTVVGDREVDHRGVITTLSNAASIVMGELGYNWKGYHGQALWMFGESSVAAAIEEKLADATGE